ncbi:MAG: inositol monophosphatase [Candidatus Nealsonbacteria bacterium]|nr:inositol monophosphatase [Candidatus Nealsonbacteria bacterium]
MLEYATTCEKAVRAGGAVVLDWIDRFEVSEKGPADLVTQADLASQDAVSCIILQTFPDHFILGEEDQASEPATSRSEFRWIVDPLDGTTNYVHRVPHFSVSLALERNGELLVGAVYDPIREECFTAIAGGGAMLNGRPIHTSEVSELPNALAAVGFPPRVATDAPDVLVFLEALSGCQAIRRTGSAALNLSYIAAGRFDLYWSFSTKVWDAAAGVLLVREAGGIVTEPDGSPFTLDDGRFLAAANDPLHKQLRELVARAGL